MPHTVLQLSTHYQLDRTDAYVGAVQHNRCKYYGSNTSIWIMLSIPLTVTLYSVLVWTEYTDPGKAAAKSWPPSAVPLCIQTGSVGTSLCLQMRVSWSEQSPPWSSRETEKAAARCSNKVSAWAVPKELTHYECNTTCIIQCSYYTTS